MTNDEDLKIVYTTLRHHLDDVFPIETIETIIQMLECYPKLKQRAKIYEEFVSDIKNVMNLNADNMKKYDIIHELLSTFGTIQCPGCEHKINLHSKDGVCFAPVDDDKQWCKCEVFG